MSGVLREILAKFGADFDGSQLKKADKQVEKTRSSLDGLVEAFGGVAIAAGATAFGASVLSSTRTLATLSARTNVSTDSIEAWRYAAEQAGASADEMDEALSELRVKTYEAAIENSDMALQFRRLGVELRDANGNLRATDDLMMEFARGIAATTDETIQLGAADALMSEEGKRLMPLFRMGTEEIARLRAEYEELGGGTTPEFIEQTRIANQEIRRLGAVFESLKMKLAAIFLPTFGRVIDFAMRLSRGLMDLNDRTRILTPVFVGLGTAAAVAGLKSAAAWIATLAPLALAAAAVAVLYVVFEDLYTLMDGGNSITGELIDGLFGVGTATRWVRILKETWEGVALAVQSAYQAVRGFFGLSGPEQTGDLARDLTLSRSRAAGQRFGNTMESIGRYLTPYSVWGDIGGSGVDEVGRQIEAGTYQAIPGFTGERGIGRQREMLRVTRQNQIDARTDTRITINGATDPAETSRQIRRELARAEEERNRRLRQNLLEEVEEDRGMSVLPGG